MNTAVVAAVGLLMGVAAFRAYGAQQTEFDDVMPEDDGGEFGGGAVSDVVHVIDDFMLENLGVRVPGKNWSDDLETRGALYKPAFGGGG